MEKAPMESMDSYEIGQESHIGGELSFLRPVKDLFADTFSEDSGNESPGSHGALFPEKDMLGGMPPKRDTFFLIKTASEKDDAYSSTFPCKMYTYPHKYDMKIGGTLTQAFQIELVFANEEQFPTMEKKSPLKVHQVTRISSELRMIRFSVNACSFHYNKRKFRIRILCEGECLYLSGPFQAFARRRLRKPKSSKITDSQMSCAVQSTCNQPFPTVDNLLSKVELSQKKSLILKLLQSLPDHDRSELIHVLQQTVA